VFRFLSNEANTLGIDLHVTDVDVSEKMIEFGKGHASNLLKDQQQQQLNNNNNTVSIVTWKIL
jgi:GH35 family endo-1,4-beta-xylanase